MSSTCRALLASDPSIEIVDEASDGRGALDLIARVSPHVVLMDIRMPRLDGFETTKAMTALGDRAQVIVLLTTFDSRGHVLTHGMASESVDSSLSLLEVDRVAREVPMQDRVTPPRGTT